MSILFMDTPTSVVDPTMVSSGRRGFPEPTSVRAMAIPWSRFFGLRSTRVFSPEATLRQELRKPPANLGDFAGRFWSQRRGCAGGDFFVVSWLGCVRFSGLKWFSFGYCGWFPNHFTAKIDKFLLPFQRQPRIWDETYCFDKVDKDPADDLRLRGAMP